MFHEIQLSAKKEMLDAVERSIDKTGIAAFLSRHIRTTAKMPFTDHRLMMAKRVSKQGIFYRHRHNSNTLSIKVVTFEEAGEVLWASCSGLFKKLVVDNIRYRFYSKDAEICGGGEFSEGGDNCFYHLENREMICEALTDYLCAVHIGLENNAQFTRNGRMISQCVNTEQSPATDPAYVVDTYKVIFSPNETLMMHMEFNPGRSEVKAQSSNYKVYGLTNVTWTKCDRHDNREGLLWEFLQGSAAEYFTQMVPFNFACDINEENSR